MGEEQYRPAPKLWQKLKLAAREMRGAPTDAELVLWERLRNRQVMGFKFRRQHAVDRFIVDFFCKEAALVIEVDGPIHDSQKEADAERQEFLEDLGFSVLRFSNDQVLCHLEAVLSSISQFLTKVK